MENNEHFCIRHPFNGIKNWWFNNGLNEYHLIMVFLWILWMLGAISVGACCWKCAQFDKDNTDTSGCADTTCIDISKSKYFTGTIYISK